MPVELTLLWTPGWPQLGLSGAVHLLLIAVAATVPGTWGAFMIACMIVSASAEAWRFSAEAGQRYWLCFRPTLDGMVLEVTGSGAAQVHVLGPFHWLYPGVVVVRARRGRWSWRWLWLFAAELEPGEMTRLRRYLGGRQPDLAH
jgi:hypothetical protein